MGGRGQCHGALLLAHECTCNCCRRAGRDPAGDSRRHPLQGTPATAVTGEAVIVRRAPDLETLRGELQRVLDSGGECAGGLGAHACSAGRSIMHQCPPTSTWPPCRMPAHPSFTSLAPLDLCMHHQHGCVCCRTNHCRGCGHTPTLLRPFVLWHRRHHQHGCGAEARRHLPRPRAAGGPAGTGHGLCAGKCRLFWIALWSTGSMRPSPAACSPETQHTPKRALPWPDCAVGGTNCHNRSPGTLMCYT